jgi:hypothetical protein
LKGFVEICHCVQECRTTSENWFLKHGYVAKMEAINFPEPNIIIMGEMDSGKSTVGNCILGSYKTKAASQFPMKAIACTSHVTQLRALVKSSAQRVDSGGDLWNLLSPPSASAPGGNAISFGVWRRSCLRGFEKRRQGPTVGKRSSKNERTMVAVEVQRKQ